MSVDISWKVHEMPGTNPVRVKEMSVIFFGKNIGLSFKILCESRLGGFRTPLDEIWQLVYVFEAIVALLTEKNLIILHSKIIFLIKDPPFGVVSEKIKSWRKLIFVLDKSSKTVMNLWCGGLCFQNYMEILYKSDKP